MATATQIFFYHLIYGSHVKIFWGNLMNIWNTETLTLKYINICVNLLHALVLFLCDTENVVLLCSIFNSLIISSVWKLYFIYNDFENIEKLCKNSILNKIYYFLPRLLKNINEFIEPFGFISNCVLLLLFYFYNRGSKYFTIILLFATVCFGVYKPSLYQLKVEWSIYDVIIRIILLVLLIILFVGNFFEFFLVDVVIRIVVSLLSVNILLFMIDLLGIAKLNSYELLSNNNVMYDNRENISEKAIILFMILLYIKQSKERKKLYFVQIGILMTILYACLITAFYS